MSQRTTGELLILAIAGTVCISILLSVIGIGLIEIVHPESDTARAVALIANILNTLVGIVAGFLAGRTDVNVRRREGKE